MSGRSVREILFSVTLYPSHLSELHSKIRFLYTPAIMKFTSIALSVICLISNVFGAPTEATAGDLKVPSEAIVGFLDLAQDKDVGVIPFSNETTTGLLFVNTTILDQATDNKANKRSAEAWHWISLRTGQPMYKRDANADPWHWISLRTGQPMYKRDANADPEADPWHWISLRAGQPMYKREADANPWHWISLRTGQPMY
ncbi:hypothetical protein HG536_0A01580 [Torulaspora globosa]|uniref:Mating factor alpha n=1 Tax=Torulaspora globosa TaxID=48254 RepID=A0A7G3ZA05_9SACH|nr:uncharacterized protein HG536_0A01580 [Torulaspora globosa]QLL30341.1 hypothetical protein HG536_0A01580 [Torulaspora globosa]